ncbi:MAG: PHP domain-containing protein [Clostridiales bacterium]|nr:MAG: PHP domain-containing protein [Clostridiales bacterium]
MRKKWTLSLTIYTFTPRFSPCGDEDMTPNNIANMAYLKGLDVIAVTDHNSCRNVSAVQKCGANAGVTVIPGMEVETSEEVHMVCLFKALDDAYEMEDYVTAHLPVIKNKPEIFGRQLVMDENDQITDIKENLLITATTLSVYDVFDAAKRIGAAVFFRRTSTSSRTVSFQTSVLFRPN